MKSMEELLREQFPELTDADFDYHYSDLYVKVLPGLIEFVLAQGDHVTASVFTNQQNGETWLDITFGNQKFWDAVAKRKH